MRVGMLSLDTGVILETEEKIAAVLNYYIHSPRSHTTVLGKSRQVSLSKTIASVSGSEYNYDKNLKKRIEEDLKILFTKSMSEPPNEILVNITSSPNGDRVINLEVYVSDNNKKIGATDAIYLNNGVLFYGRK